MSHYVGIVITTPSYIKNGGTLTGSLKKYDCEIKVEPYVVRNVDAIDKYRIIEHFYLSKTQRDKIENQALNYIRNKVGEKDFYTFEDYTFDPSISHGSHCFEKYRKSLLYYKDEYKQLFNQFLTNTQTEILNSFEEVYAIHGDEWNYGIFKKNSSGVWQLWSNDNRDSKYDGYDLSKGLLTKNGHLVSVCLSDELDFDTPNTQTYDTKTYHLNKTTVPYCMVIDGKWYEKGKDVLTTNKSTEIGSKEWECMVVKLINELPEGSSINCIDFHI